MRIDGFESPRSKTSQSPIQKSSWRYSGAAQGGVAADAAAGATEAAATRKRTIEETARIPRMVRDYTRDWPEFRRPETPWIRRGRSSDSGRPKCSPLRLRGRLN